MSETPETRASLLVRIRDPRDDEAWRQFLALYEPLLRAFARKRYSRMAAWWMTF